MTTMPLTPTLADPAPSRARWLLALMIFGCFFLATQNLGSPLEWRDDGSADIASRVDRVAGGQATRQIGFLALAGFGTLGLLLPSKQGRRELVWPVLYPLVAIVAWAYLSMLWSDNRGLTARRLVVFTAMWTSIAALVKHFRPRDLAFVVAFYGIVTLSLGLYAEWMHRGQAGSQVWRFSGTGSPNHAGLNAFLLSLAMLHGLGRRGFFGAGTSWRWLVLLGAMGILWMTRSRTALAITVTSLGVAAALMTRPGRAVAVATISGIAIAGVIFLFHTGVLGPVWEAALMGRDSANIRTMTGRTDIWAFTLQEATGDVARLVVGHGHDTFWSPERTQAVSQKTAFPISEAHNAYLESWMNLGMIGLFAWPMAVGGSALVWLSRGRTDTGVWSADAAMAIALSLAALVHGFAESAFTHAQFATFALFGFCAFAAIRPAEQEAT
ncbi:MAG: O-antigen ligase family protein [Planctomycetota bacterium]